MPRRVGEALRALYDFCREADDAVDDAADALQAQQHIARLRARVATWYSNDIPDDSLAHTVRRYGLQREHFDALLDGMMMDVSGSMVAPSLAVLSLYCHRVAGCVGLLSLAIFGCTTSAEEAFAHAAGQAMQITNILRDIQEDRARGRLYLPLEWLLAEDACASQQSDGALERVCMRLAHHAQSYYDEAQHLSLSCSRRLLPAILMCAIYQGYLRTMQERGCFLSHRPVRLSWQRKLGVSVQALRFVA